MELRRDMTDVCESTFMVTKIKSLSYLIGTMVELSSNAGKRVLEERALLFTLSHTPASLPAVFFSLF